MFRFTTIALLLTLASAFDVPSLTPENYDELTDGKTVFIKFFAPWVSTAMTAEALPSVATVTCWNRQIEQRELIVYYFII